MNDIFNTIAAATKTENQKYKPKFYYLRKCVQIINKSKKNSDLYKARNFVNDIFKIHQDAKNLISLMEKNKEWDLLQDNQDYYYLIDSVEKAYFIVKDIYHEIHWDKKGFNAY